MPPSNLEEKRNLKFSNDDFYSRTRPFLDLQHHSSSNVQKKQTEFFAALKSKNFFCSSPQCLLDQKPTQAVVTNQKHNHTGSRERVSSV